MIARRAKTSSVRDGLATRARLGSAKDDGCSSRDDVLDRIAEVEVESLAAGNFKSAGIETELAQDRGVNVGHVVAVFNGSGIRARRCGRG